MASIPTGLPTPDSVAQLRSQQLAQIIQQAIQKSNGWITFATFMHMALYTPSLGYYSGGTKKFGDSLQGGDFVTAPEISPLFAKTLARQAAQVLLETQGGILELGAGTGKLASDLLLELQALKRLPRQYFIMEVSDYLRQIQRENLQKQLSTELFQLLVWLDTLPASFSGLVLANEVLDAIPVHLVVNKEQGFYERGVAFDGDFSWQDNPLDNSDLMAELHNYSIPTNYLTEVCTAANGLIRSLSFMLSHGAVLMLDYGFGAAEYYHPQRNLGTLMCHYQHHAHTNPLIHVGLQDITAHVNFTAIAEAGVSEGLALSGYCNQAQFLINCGILEVMAQVSPNDLTIYAPMAAAAQKLLSPAEMGELFKVIAISKGMNIPLIGFTQGDKSHTL